MKYRIQLNHEQLAFLEEMFENQEYKKNMQLFANLMIDEGLDPQDMPKIIDRIALKYKQRK